MKVKNRYKILLIAIFFTIIILLPNKVFASITDGELTYDIYQDEAKVIKCSETAINITIPEIVKGYPVTGIEQSAFRNCQSLDNITIPEGITYIGYSAFRNCTNLKNIIIPETVISIEGDAFYGCTNLQSIKLPSKITEISENLFTECKKLTDVVIPDNVIEIKTSAFSRCTSLEEINLPDNIKNIGEYAFYNCNSLKNIAIPKNVTSILYGTFNKCINLKSVIILPTVNSIDTAFAECTNLTLYVVKGSVQEKYAIDNNINFEYYELPEKEGELTYKIDDETQKAILVKCDKLATKATILSTYKGYPVTKIEYNAFEGCVALESVNISEKITYIGESAFSNCVALENINIPEKTTYIGANVFNNCCSLRNLVIPESVTSIGAGIFQNCTNLQNVKLPSKMTEIPEYFFHKCKNLNNIIIPDSIIEIKQNAFSNCTGLEEINLPDNIKNIGENAFLNCTSLRSVNIPKNVTSIVNIFNGCTNLKSVIILPNVISIEKDFVGYENLTLYVVRDSVAEKYAINNNINLEYYELPEKEGELTYKIDSETKQAVLIKCDRLATKATISSTYKGYPVTKIKDNAFDNCIALKTVNIPEGIIIIGSRSFYNCINLKNVTIPNSTKYIGGYTFENCKSLTNMTIPSSVEEIGGGIFENCIKLEIVTLNNIEISSDMFKNCKKLTTIIMNNKINFIGYAAFMNCSELESFTVPNGVTEPRGGTFWGCTNLKKVTIPHSVNDMNISSDEAINSPYVFDHNNSNLTLYVTKGSVAEIHAINYGINYEIYTYPISECSVSEITNQIYTGKQILPKVIVKDGEVVLKNGVDYEVTYKDNINIGKASVVINGIGNYSGTISKDFLIKLEQIKKVTSSNSSQSTITIKWNKALGSVTGYEIYMSTSKNGKYSKIATITRPSTTYYKKTKLVAGKTYYFKVRAYKTINKKNNYGAYSGILTAGTSTKTTSITKVVAGKKKATVKWKKVSGAKGYEVYMSKSKNGKYKKIATTSKISYTKTKLVKNKKYYFKVRTYRIVNNKKIYSSYSNIKNVKVK